MKFFKKLILGVFAFSIVLLIYVIAVFQIEDTTLSKGEIKDFNSGWTLQFEEQDKMETITVDTLPYLGKCSSQTTVTMSNTIPKQYFGKTMCFLSADKTLEIWIDGKEVYEFGLKDNRTFGKTPGSIVNFVDIPADTKTGMIQIKMLSPYDDYAARISSITVGERDVLILKLLKSNIVNIMLDFVILVCGFIFFLLFLIRKISKENTRGMQYLSAYCITAAVYYFIETKIMHIFYGNQTLYSVMVFLCLIMMPFFIALYYGTGIFSEFKKRWRVLLTLAALNALLQFAMQLSGVADFMDMAFLSHGLIMVTVVLIVESYIELSHREYADKTIHFGIAAALFMGAGGVIDIIRMYIVAVGDMGKFSRLGTTVYSIIMLYLHFRQIVMGYSRNMEENARLIQREIEYVETKNKQLEQANKEAEEAREEALYANAAKGKFLAHMSHEIRTPINAVLGMDTMILREATDKKIKEYAMDIQNAGQNLLSLINDILDFSKIESGKLEINCVEYDFCSMIHDIFNMIQAKAQGKQLALEMYMEEDLPSKLYGDDIRIRQVLVNLLNNAVKYTQKGKVSLDIKGKTDGKKILLTFVVEDTGIGIKEEDMHKLFEEFERIEEKRNRNIEGTGLGMSITTQLLFMMGSRLCVESVYGKGSKFYFTLEQQVVDSTPIGNLEERLRKQSLEYSYMAAFTAPEAQLLVVDDNLTNLRVFVNLLKYTGVHVDTADSGKACLEMIGKKRYDLIFLDHMMPEMDGVETLEKMRELDNNQSERAPVVALTANAIAGAKEMYLAKGFDAFLPKPINPEKLEQMILRLLPRELLKFEDPSGGYLKTDSTFFGTDAGGQQEDMELPMIDGIDWTYGKMHLPDRELLLATIGDFYKAMDIEAEALERFYNGLKEDADILAQYRIKVHAMKSSANLIGAIALGGMAKVLENAARDGKIETIESIHDSFILEWKNCKESLKENFFAKEEENEQMSAADRKELKAEDVEIVLAYLKLLWEAFEELDIDEMDQMMQNLMEYKFPSEIQENIDRLSAFVTNMDMEGAQPLIDTIREQLEYSRERGI